MTGEKGGLLAGLRAEALKSRHAAPVRLAVLMALPMPLLGAMPYRGVQIFSAWNYWYALFLPVSLSLVVACVARADARTRMRGLLGLGFPLGRAWWAKALWCLALCTLSNLVVFGIYLAGSAFSSQGLTAAGTLTMLLCALANTVTAAWMIPAGLFLTARLGMLAGIFCPLAAQLVGGFAWSLVPLPQLFPPSANMVIPTSFIPVLPSGEPLAADMALGGALMADGMLTLAGLAVCALAFAALKAAGVTKTVMLTGDIQKVADYVARDLGVDEVRAELLPADKVVRVEELLQAEPEGAKLAFVGDGINDAPVLSRADIGIAMGAMGSDAAIEAADVVLMDDDPMKLAKAIKISRRCLRIVRENIVFSLGVKLLCLLLVALGFANMWMGIFADVGVMVLAVLNAIRALRVHDL